MDTNNILGTDEGVAMYGGEIVVYTQVAQLDKNLRRQIQIPLQQLHMNHLPEGYKDSCLVDYIRTVSDLTVRVLVKYVSGSRSEPISGGSDMSQDRCNRGSEIMRVGSGWVKRVDKFPNEYNECVKLCECTECAHPCSTPKARFAYISIHTAAHVVFDDTEAVSIKCELLFCKDNTADICDGVISLNGVSKTWADPESGVCQLLHITHDMEVADRLENTLRRAHHLLNILRLKYSAFRQMALFPDTPVEDHKKALTVAVSHPWRYAKRITIGCYDSPNNEQDTWGRYTYTIPTCPGSSGAPVFCPWSSEDNVFMVGGNVNTKYVCGT